VLGRNTRRGCDLLDGQKLGSASDFWPGYSEYPRSVWASVKYRF